LISVVLILCNIDFSCSDFLLNGQVSIQRLQENNDKRYVGMIIYIKSSHFRDCSVGSELGMDGSIHGSQDALSRERSHQAADMKNLRQRKEMHSR